MEVKVVISSRIDQPSLTNYTQCNKASYVEFGTIYSKNMIWEKKLLIFLGNKNKHDEKVDEKLSQINEKIENISQLVTRSIIDWTL